MNDIKPLQLAVVAILEKAKHYEWSVQGFGMLRLYIRNIGRLHIWDSRLEYPGVSKIHNHSWDLRSTIVFGELTNTVFGEHSRGVLFSGKRLVTGYQTRDVQALPDTKLAIIDQQTFTPGDAYAQAASKIHRSDAVDGTVTLMERNEDENGQADVYWLHGTEWGTAKPREATVAEIEMVTQSVLRKVLL